MLVQDGQLQQLRQHKEEEEGQDNAEHVVNTPSDRSTLNSQDSRQHDSSAFPAAPLKEEDYIVRFIGKDDPLNPQNWPTTKKFYVSTVGAYACLCSTFASTIWSSSTSAVGHVFGVSAEVSTLTTSLFLFGYAFGPLVWGPLSELRGRRLPIVASTFGFMLFSAGAATGKDLQTVIICRFFAGTMGSGPLTVMPGVFGDIYDHEHRPIAIAMYAICLFLG